MRGDNLRYKLLAVACAISLYLMYGRTVEAPMTYASLSAPVRPINVPRGLEVSSLPAVVVTVQGPKRAIDEILRRPDKGAAELDATVDLSGRGPGSHTLPVSAVVKKPLNAVSGAPPFATVTLEAVRERRLPVEVAPQGSVAPGYRWESTDVTPNTALVRGAGSLVEQVTRLEARVPVRGAAGDVERDAVIQALDSRDEPVPRVAIIPSQVVVHVRIARVPQYKVAPIVLRWAGRPAPGFMVASVILDPVAVTVSGSDRALGNVQAVATEPVNLSGATSTIIQEVRLLPPEGIKLVSDEKARVKVFLTRESLGTP